MLKDRGSQSKTINTKPDNCKILHKESNCI